MNQIKNLLSKLSQELRDLLKKFPVTMALILFLTLLFTVIVDQNFSRNTRELLERVETFCAIWLVGTFFTETFFEMKRIKMTSYVTTGMISGIFIRLTCIELTSSVANLCAKILATYIAVLILISIYQVIKKSKLTFERYLLGVFRDLLSMTIIYVILNIGFVLIFEIFNVLLLEGKGNSGLVRIFILLYGLFYVPSILYTISAINQKEINTFIRGLVNYVLLLLVNIAMAIVYLYIAKILILRDMPKNVIFRILAGIFVVAFPVWNMASCCSEEKKWVGKMAKTLPVLYVPFIFLEIYAIVVRIAEFGVTPMRYISCVFIVFQVICLGLTFYKKKEKLSFTLIGAAILVFVAVLTPLGYENISNLSQKKMIEKWLPENADFALLKETEKAKVKSAYHYLERETDGKKYIPDYLSEEVITEISSYHKNEQSDYAATHYFSGSKELDLDISNYRKIRSIQGYSKDNTRHIKTGTEELDFSSFVKEMMQKNTISREEAKNYFDANNLVNLSETVDFYVENVDLEYLDDAEIRYFRIQGYLLEK